MMLRSPREFGSRRRNLPRARSSRAGVADGRTDRGAGGRAAGLGVLV
jgi:hypothetical protein